MKVTTNPFKIKLSILILAMSCIVIIFWLNRIIINQLRFEARKQVEFLAKSYSDAINSSKQEDIRFVMDILLPSLNFPIIITSKDEISAVLNLNIKAINNSDKYYSLSWEIVNKMDKTFPPLDLVWNNMKWGKIHYSDPMIVNHLQWMPYLEAGFVIIIISISIWGLQLIRRSEKNYIYVGMARETAHQLGTPVSSLMGWIKLLRGSNSDSSNILNAIDEDIIRLSEISERFSKIGSKPQLKPLIISELIDEVSLYIKNRLPEKSEIKIICKSGKNIYINGDRILLSWAIENLMKNAIDAIGIGNGEIRLIIKLYENSVSLEIKDTGKGINRRDWKNIFMPGFSSKHRGWGLGLSLTQRIIEVIHGGRIRVISSKPLDTIFRLDFPI